MNHLISYKIFEEFTLKDIKSKDVKDAIDIIKRYGIKIKFINDRKIGGAAIMVDNLMLIPTYMMRIGKEFTISTLFHELGHFYCYDKGIFNGYHQGVSKYISEISEDEIKIITKTAIRAEAYVDNWAKNEMKKYFPHLKYEGSYYKKSDNIKRWILNYIYDIYGERIIELESEKLDRILKEMGI